MPGRVQTTFVGWSDLDSLLRIRLPEGLTAVAGARRRFPLIRVSAHSLLRRRLRCLPMRRSGTADKGRGTRPTFRAGVGLSRGVWAWHGTRSRRNAAIRMRSSI